MAEFLTGNSISYYIEKIIKEASTELNLCIPYLQLSKEFYEALKDSSDRDVSIVIVYTNENLQTEEKLLLGEIKNLEIYQSGNLNVKYCCNEHNVLITTMDIHQFIESPNIEMGVIFNNIKDTDLYKKTYAEIKSIITSSKNMNLHKREIAELNQPGLKVKKIYHGFCIKCAMPISHNPEKPYCRRCMTKNNSDTTCGDEVFYCHLCGLTSSTGMINNLCEACEIENR